VGEVRAILDGVHGWSIFQEDKQLDFNGLHLQLPDGCALVDPPALDEEQAARIEALGKPTTILVTNRNHLRAGPALRERFGARLLVPALDAGGIDAEVDGTFADGDVLLGGLRAILLPDLKSPGETALYWEERRILILGDALIGAPAGSLRFLPPAKVPHPAVARAGLQERLGGLAVDALLLGDGASISPGGGAVLKAFLAD
jgi:glyoxylase-like metal-dependent hydrolase (beta-lactamase superfamily II)